MAHYSSEHGMTDVSPHRETSASNLTADLVTSLRPDQWTKNLIVFAGLVFGGQLMEPTSVFKAAGAFGAFCALSSAMYLVNDLGDRSADRLHPVKAKRPIAAGRISSGVAMGAVVVLLALGLGAGFVLNPMLGGLSLLFVALLTLYSRLLKHVVVLDVLTIAVGFVLRAVAGAVAVGVPSSQWLLVCTLLGALFLGLTKRRQEVDALGEHATEHRPALGRYSVQGLDQMVTIVAGATVLSYAVYTTDPNTIATFGTDLLTLTIPFPVYGVLRYLLIMREHPLASPSDLLLRDPGLAWCAVGWSVAVALIIYRPLG